MNLSSLTPDEAKGWLEDPLDALFFAFHLISLAYLEKHPSPTKEELFAVLTVAVFEHPRGRHWIMRMNTSISRKEMEEITKRLEVLQKQGEELAAFWGTGQRLPERLQLYGENIALSLRFHSSPFAVRLRTRLLKQREKKQARNARAGRQRNNKRAAEHLVEFFQQQKKALLLIQGRTPQVAAREAVDYVIGHFQTVSRTKDKQAVLELFKEILREKQKP